MFCVATDSVPSEVSNHADLSLESVWKFLKHVFRSPFNLLLSVKAMTIVMSRKLKLCVIFAVLIKLCLLIQKIPQRSFKAGTLFFVVFMGGKGSFACVSLPLAGRLTGEHAAGRLFESVKEKSKYQSLAQNKAASRAENTIPSHTGLFLYKSQPAWITCPTSRFTTLLLDDANGHFCRLSTSSENYNAFLQDKSAHFGVDVMNVVLICSTIRKIFSSTKQSV